MARPDLPGMKSWERKGGGRAVPRVEAEITFKPSGFKMDMGGMTRTFEDAVALARDGWANGLRDVSRLLEELYVTSDVMEFDDRAGFDVAGPYPMVPLYCAHDPMHFRVEGMSRAPTPVIELVLQVGAHAGTTARQMMNFGASFLAFVDRLEAGGQRVGVSFVMVFKDSMMASGTGTMTVQTRVKRPEDPVSLDTLTFAVAHPGTFRRLGFALLESWRTDAWVEAFSSGYGRTERFRLSSLRDIDERAVLLPGVGAGGDWDTPADAIRSMRGILTAASSGALADLLSSSH